MKKILLFFSSVMMITCQTLKSMNLTHQTNAIDTNSSIIQKQTDKIEEIKYSKVLTIIGEEILDKYTMPNVFRVYSTAEHKLVKVSDLELAIKNKLYILTEGLTFEVKLLNIDGNEILMKSINKEVLASVNLADHILRDRRFNLLINLEQTSDLQQLILLKSLFDSHPDSKDNWAEIDKQPTNPPLFSDLYTREFESRDEVVTYINTELRRSVWTQGIKAFQYIPLILTEFSSFTNGDDHSKPIENYSVLDLKLNDYVVKIKLFNLQSKNKRRIGNNAWFLTSHEVFLTQLIEKNKTMKRYIITQQQLIDLFNFCIFINDRMHPPRSEKIISKLQNPSLSASEKSQWLLSVAANVSKKFFQLHEKDSRLIEGQNLLKLKISPKLEENENFPSNHNMHINWTKNEENYSDIDHEFIKNYIVNLEKGSWTLENKNNLTDKNRQSDLLPTIVEDINDFLGSRGLESRLCCNTTFFHRKYPVPIRFLNPDILLNKGNNKILIKITLDNYVFPINYSIII